MKTSLTTVIVEKLKYNEQTTRHLPELFRRRCFHSYSVVCTRRQQELRECIVCLFFF